MEERKSQTNMLGNNSKFDKTGTFEYRGTPNLISQYCKQVSETPHSNIDYTERDLEESLRKAFVDNQMPSILFDGHEARSDFKRKGIEYGLNEGLIKVGSQYEDDQYTAINYILTKKGEEHFGLAKKLQESS